MTNKASYYFSKLKKKYLFLRISEVLLWSLAVATITYAALIFVPLKSSLHAALSAGSGCLALTILTVKLQFLKITEEQLISFINIQFPVLQQSADLLVRENESLTSLQLLQQNKIRKTFEDVYPNIKIPNHIGRSFLVFTVCLGLTMLVMAFDFKLGNSSDTAEFKESDATQNTLKKNLPVAIERLSITVTPPRYTNQRPQTVDNPNLEILEGSMVSWNIAFSDSVKEAWIVFNDDSLALKNKMQFNANRTFTSSSFYQIVWRNDNTLKASDYYKIEVTADKQPEITVRNLTQFTELSINDKLNIAVNAAISDDYGLSNAYIIATVSKGSGESVKFREEKLNFTAPSKIAGKKVQASTQVDLLKLGMEPGDELYFYVEALDNKVPVANRARTETFFILLQDTTTEETSIEGGLGVDLMPEYFRSQRQIIIDSEKLLKEQKKITKQTFSSRSNELGYDQKVLRLKYGEFLGEEFESGIGPASSLPSEEDHEEEEEDVTKKYGHTHDTENEHNIVPDKKSEEHDHDHKAEGDSQKDENPMDAYMHVHDDPEEATFFTQSIRAKLKAALTVMWDAELHLRLHDPKTSLPYQYKALKLLKEISNDSRIYVHKTGFDPPPIKEEKRLSGDLSEIKNTRNLKSTIDTEAYPAIRKALVLTETLIAENANRVSVPQKEILLKAGTELSALALQRPAQFLTSLSLIKSINADEVSKDKVTASLIIIRESLWKALPNETSKPTSSNVTTTALNQSFINNLETLKNE
jgi:hypothetical protein